MTNNYKDFLRVRVQDNPTMPIIRGPFGNVPQCQDTEYGRLNY